MKGIFLKIILCVNVCVCVCVSVCVGGGGCLPFTSKTHLVLNYAMDAKILIGTSRSDHVLPFP